MRYCLTIPPSCATMGMVGFLFDLKDDNTVIDPGSWGTSIYVYHPDPEFLQAMKELAQEAAKELTKDVPDFSIVEVYPQG